jgi:FkbM family methyltransferase
MGLLPARIASKPQYVFHPVRAVRRMMHRTSDADGRREVAELPWGLPLEVYMSDSIGYSIVTGGVFDPCVTETLWRLIDPGDVVVDVGGNVGYLTSLAAVRSGREGKVLSCEPHPRVHELLERNAGRWRERAHLDNVEIRRIALADREGEGTLEAPAAFHANMGLAALADGRGAESNGDTFTVQLARLDDVAPAERVGVLKVDVEGHEPDVFRGAERLLSTGAVRDIVFEDLEEYPSEATALVEAAGYDLIALDNDLWGLRLVAPKDRGEVPAWPGPSYLATRDRARAVERLSPRGWQVSGIGPSLLPRRRAPRG